MQDNFQILKYKLLGTPTPVQYPSDLQLIANDMDKAIEESSTMHDALPHISISEIDIDNNSDKTESHS